MSKLGIKSSWNRIKGRAKQKVARLIGSARLHVEGRDDVILGRIQKAISRIKHEVLPSPSAR